MKGLVTSYMAHCLINGIIGIWESGNSHMTIRGRMPFLDGNKPTDFGV
jgi:hypothetical protein